MGSTLPFDARHYMARTSSCWRHMLTTLPIITSQRSLGPCPSCYRCRSRSIAAHRQSRGRYIRGARVCCTLRTRHRSVEGTLRLAIRTRPVNGQYKRYWRLGQNSMRPSRRFGATAASQYSDFSSDSSLSSGCPGSHVSLADTRAVSA